MIIHLSRPMTGGPTHSCQTLVASRREWNVIVAVPPDGGRFFLGFFYLFIVSPTKCYEIKLQFAVVR